MSLDLSRLENVCEKGDKIIARCPACAEQKHDEKGDHLIIYPNGAFGCVTCPGVVGHGHRKQIVALAGDLKSRQRWGCFIRVRRPAPAKLPKFAETVVDLGEFGTLGTGFQNPYAMRENVCVSENEKRTHREETHTLRSDEKASQTSQPTFVMKRQAPLQGCDDPLVNGALKLF
jgi:hypothetical protein